MLRAKHFSLRRLFILSLCLFAFHFALRWSLFEKSSLREFNDTQDYVRIAEQIAKEGVLSDKERLPGYSLFLYSVSILGGSSATQEFRMSSGSVQKAQWILGSLCPVMWFLCGFLLTGFVWISFFLSGVLFLNFFWIQFDNVMLTESLTCFFVHALILSTLTYLWNLKKENSLSAVKSFGFQILIFCILAYLFLLKPTFVFLGPLWCLLLWAVSFQWKASWVHTWIVAAFLFPLIVHGFSSENERKHGFYGLTVVGHWSFFFKTLRNKWYEHPKMQEEPLTQVVQEILAEQPMGSFTNSFCEREIGKKRPELLENGLIHLRDWGLKGIFLNFGDYLKTTLLESVYDLSGSSNTYYSLDRAESGWAHKLTRAALAMFKTISHWQRIWVGISLLGYIFLVFKRGFWIFENICVLFSLICSFYVHLFSEFFNFTEFYRMRFPVDPIFLLIFMGVLGGFHYLKKENFYETTRFDRWRNRFSRVSSH